MIFPLLWGIALLLTITTESVDNGFLYTDITIVTIHHNLRKILENSCPKLDNSILECMLSIDKGRYHKRSRPMTTLLLFAVAIIVAVAANSAMNPRMP